MELKQGQNLRIYFVSIIIVVVVVIIIIIVIITFIINYYCYYYYYYYYCCCYLKYIYIYNILEWCGVETGTEPAYLLYGSEAFLPVPSDVYGRHWLLYL